MGIEAPSYKISIAYHSQFSNIPVITTLGYYRQAQPKTKLARTIIKTNKPLVQFPPIPLESSQNRLLHPWGKKTSANFRLDTFAQDNNSLAYLSNFGGILGRPIDTFTHRFPRFIARESRSCRRALNEKSSQATMRPSGLNGQKSLYGLWSPGNSYMIRNREAFLKQWHHEDWPLFLGW